MYLVYIIYNLMARCVARNPKEIVRQVAAAKELLRQSNLAIGEIGWRVGMGDGGQFARVFKQHSGVTPQAYRRAVRGKLFAPERD